MSEKSAEAVIQLMSLHEQPLLCPASGDTPTGLFKTLVEKYRAKKIDPSSWSFVGLDEWVGLNGNDEGSCRQYLDKNLFRPLNVPENKIIFFDGRAENLEDECKKTENFIQQNKGLHVAILGLGTNGHIGMNEPECDVAQHVHVVQLHPSTIQAGQKYFQKPQPLDKGITLGIEGLMESRHIILLASGKHKAEIVKKVIKGEVTPKVPGSLLHNHPSCTVFLDADAASML
ncbi:MAG: glucosamine-6-phosphate deaminase [Chitinophagaceae bacterium]|jgi:glucosamine-6-phosphate isomerase|nr:glucosamine-6-phosphate deaminase [Chitinophagaceae bacterium]